MEWRTAVGFDRYEISDTGLVRCKETGELVTPRSNHGYAYLYLRRDEGNGKTRARRALVHRLVADAFMVKPEGKTEIDHINCIRDDNRVENLRWCTKKENMNNELTKEAMRNAAQKMASSPEYRRKQSEAHTYKKKPVRCIETGEEFPSCREAAKALGLGKSTVMYSAHMTEEGRPRMDHSKGKTILHFEFIPKSDQK